VTSCNDPWGFRAIHRGEILLQPLDLGASRGEWAGVLGSRATGEIRCIEEVGFRVELNEVNHSMVPGVPEVFDTARLSSRHAVKK